MARVKLITQIQEARLVLSLALVSSWCPEALADTCESNFLKLAQQKWEQAPEVIKKAALWLPRQQERYWRDVAETGGRRLILVRREPVEEFNKKVLWDPFAYPATIPPEILKTKYTLSSPAVAILSLPGVVTAYSWIDGMFMKGPKTGSESIPGTEYARSLFSEGMIAVQSKIKNSVGASTPSSELIHILAEHKGQFEKWLGPSGTWKDLERIRQLRSLGVLKSDEEAQELNLFAKKIIQKAAQNPAEGDFSAQLDSAWKSALQDSPRYASRPRKDLLLLSLLFTPPTTVALERESVRGKTYSDLELLNRIYGGEEAAFSPLAAHWTGTDPVSMLKMGIQILEKPEIVNEKMSHWKRFTANASEAPPSFVLRPDFPALSKADLRFYGKGDPAQAQTLKDEISIWELIWSDPRFTNIKEAFQKRELPESEALRLTLNRVGAYNEFYRVMNPNPVPDESRLCSWIESGSEAEGASLIQLHVSSVLNEIMLRRKLTQEQSRSCAVEIAEFYAHYFQSEAGAVESMERFTGLLRSAASELAQLKSGCPKKVHSCRP